MDTDINKVEAEVDENTESTETTETKVDETTSTETEESNIENQGQENQETLKPSEQVPLAKYVDEKKKRQAMEKRLAELEDKQFEGENKEIFSNAKQEWLDKGFDEATADAMANERVKYMSEIKGQRKSATEKLLETEIEEISQVDDFYKDMGTYKSEIVKKVSKAKKAGIDLDVKAAYLSIVGTDRKMKEYETEKNLINQNENKAKGTNTSTNVPTGGSSATGGNPYKLDADDKKALKELQKMMPDSGWTEEKYYKTRKNE